MFQHTLSISGFITTNLGSKIWTWNTDITMWIGEGQGDVREESVGRCQERRGSAAALRP